MAERLAKKGVETKIIANQITDYVIDRQRGVERKTIADFLASIADRRIFEQALTLRRYFYRPVILLEGGGLYTHNVRMKRETIRGVLVWLATTVRVPVVRTYGKEDTADFLAMLAEQSVGRLCSIERCARQKPKKSCSEKEEVMRVLCSIGGIGRVAAKELLTALGSLGTVATASTNTLARVPRIGIKTASRIERVFRAEWEKEGVGTTGKK